MHSELAILGLCWALAIKVAIAHVYHASQKPMAGPHQSLWYNTLPGDGGTQGAPEGEHGVLAGA